MFNNLKKSTTYQIQIYRNIIFPHREGRIAIIGCGRSGTTYTSKLFKAFGYSVGHEALGKHGISSWCLVPDTRQRCWGPSLRELARLKLPFVHQVRHPLKVIASIATFGSHSWEFISNFIPIEKDDTLTQMCMKYWYHWNLLAEKRAKLTYQVELIEDALPKLLTIGGFDESRFDLAVVRGLRNDVNRRDHESTTWDSLEKEDPKLAEQIRELATRFGYSAS